MPRIRARWTLLSSFVVGIVGGALASACQTYDFEPVDPLALAQTTIVKVIQAKALKPNVMVLLDTSGSMALPVDSTDPDCKIPNGVPPNDICGQSAATPCNVNVCPTRWSELRSAMSSFLTSSGAIARLGLTTYPAYDGTNNSACFASSSVRISIPQVEDTDTVALQNVASQISNEILNKPQDFGATGGPGGGTPTSASLKFVGALPELQGEERQDFVLLLTDGLPNCNGSNPNAGNPTTCRCTQTQCGQYLPNVCLDKDESVKAVSDLSTQKGVKTIVIGFGADTAAGVGPETLNAMAETGGFARNCLRDPNACGVGDTCDTSTPDKLCGRRFYQAANQAELAQALTEIINKLGNQDPCLLALDPAQLPSDKSLLVVYVNREAVPEGPNSWELTEEGVKFVGSTCDRILASTNVNPIELEVRAIQRK